jgi:hypothetical protein
MLTLYPTTLLKVCIRLKSFLGESLGSFKYKITSFANRGKMTSSFLICRKFNFFLLPYCSG